jgi:hypothetical protein
MAWRCESSTRPTRPGRRTRHASTASTWATRRRLASPLNPDGDGPRAACIKSIAGTDSCQVRYVGVAESGRLHVAHEDGTEAEIGPGDAHIVEPGHDA